MSDRHNRRNSIHGEGEPMARILIDANIYIDLFKTSDKSLLRHIPVLVDELRHEIHISTQLVDEIERNKVQIATRFITEKLEQINIPIVSLPVFQDSTNDSLREMATNASREAISELAA
ncbi:MAG: hypothetical protein DI536_05140 [Archangium gephyra]|uniref:PIN domain-containing protein n=1 Tax=Archangium gephyra TaxID=48 RepID=A0A2W5W3F3_9BACT|nr:MAG: hypothetical protein DI536_05140 [Archangium gephyra]